VHHKNSVFWTCLPAFKLYTCTNHITGHSANV